MTPSKSIVVKCPQGTDELGNLEEFTSDLHDIVDVDVSHLASVGLPRPGARVVPGMLLVGKIGEKRTHGFTKMNEIQLLTASRDELRADYRRWIYDGSAYASAGCAGTVVRAWFETVDDRQQAVVEIACECLPNLR